MDHRDKAPREADRPVAVAVHDDMLWVTLADGRVIATPLTWYPRLQRATAEQLAGVELGRAGIHWPALDEDLSVQGMLDGQPAGLPPRVASA